MGAVEREKMETMRKFCYLAARIDEIFRCDSKVYIGIDSIRYIAGFYFSNIDAFSNNHVLILLEKYLNEYIDNPYYEVSYYDGEYSGYGYYEIDDIGAGIIFCSNDNRLFF